MSSFFVDMMTIYIVLFLGHLLTGILMISYTVQHNKDKSVNTFLLSKLCQAVAWAMLGLRRIVPDFISIGVGNSLLFTGAALELIALLILKNNYTKSVKKNYNALLIVCIFIFNVITAYGAAENIRTSFASLITVALMAYPVYTLIKEKSSSLVQKVILTFYCLTMIALVYRAIMAPKLGTGLLTQNIPNTLLFLLLYLVMLVGSTGFILLAKEKLDAEMIRAASFDELTNIFNRRTFILRSKEILSLFVRKQEQISYLLIDIDNFKKINDVYGHYTGDIVLEGFASIIRKQLRDYDIFGRYGGEEFAVLLPGTDEKGSDEVAERLRKLVENSQVGEDQKIGYTVSIGVVTIIPDRETTVDILYRLADDALYMAKTQGKNRVVRFENAT